jgi:hypothetical protein
VWVLNQTRATGPGEILINDDGAWCWFQDERAIISNGKLFVGSVASGYLDPNREGNVELVEFDLEQQKGVRSVLHDGLGLDDHNSPALTSLPDGGLLAIYARHGSENKVYYRRSGTRGRADIWGPESAYIPSESSRVTYSNLFLLASEELREGRLYNFFRGLDNSLKPSFIFSDDGGASWKTGNIVIDVPEGFRHRPYVKYASDGHSTVHLLYTEGHPRDYDNSVYHLMYRDGMLSRSDGSPVSPLTRGLQKPEDGSLVFQGDADNVAWVSDLHVSSEGHPVAVITVQKDSAGLPRGEGGKDHRYRYAFWDGQRWRNYEVGFAGERLYSGEDDYTGNICLDPQRLDTVYLSTNVSPTAGTQLESGHYEIFRGRTGDGGKTWEFKQITRGSEVDNLRPIVPTGASRHNVLLWLKGHYTSYTDFALAVVGIVSQPG